MEQDVREQDYQSLHAFRYAVRRFLKFSEDAARAAGIEPQQHQLLLTVKAGFANSVGELAERMQLQHHSTVELLDRVVANGYAVRSRAEDDGRRVVITLTEKGEAVLRELSVLHRARLRQQAGELLEAINRVLSETEEDAPGGGSGQP